MLLLRRSGCRAHVCPDCGPVRGMEVRKRLIESGLFRNAAMISLTVDRGRFPSPLAALDYVRENRLLWRLMRALRIANWFWVLEFQKSGGGWPHWHLLVDCSAWGGRLPRQSLLILRRLWSVDWGVGSQIDVKASDGQGDHFVNYTTKYLIKQPESGYPTWVLMHDQRIRFLAASRSVGPMVVRLEVQSRVSVSADDEVRAHMRPLAFRLVECGSKTAVFAESVEPDSGEVKLAWLGAVRVPVRMLIERATSRADGRFSASIGIGDDGETFVRKNAVCLDVSSLDGVSGVVKKLFGLEHGELVKNWVGNRAKRLVENSHRFGEPLDYDWLLACVADIPSDDIPF